MPLKIQGSHHFPRWNDHFMADSPYHGCNFSPPKMGTKNLTPSIKWLHPVQGSDRTLHGTHLFVIDPEQWGIEINTRYPRVMTNSLLLKIAIEIVDLQNMLNFHSYVSLPESMGICWTIALQEQKHAHSHNTFIYIMCICAVSICHTIYLSHIQ